MARILGVDLPRDKRVEIGLTYIYGIGLTRAKKICEETGVNPDTRVRDLTEEEVVQRLNCEIAFKVTPHFSGEDTPEVMLTVYPYENMLTGSAVQWLKVTSDKDYFLHKYSNK